MISWVGNTQNEPAVYESETLIVKRISEHSFIHVSFLETENFGKVPCNGLVVISDKKAVVLETPVNNEVSMELIRWVENEQNARIKAVIVHHFHIDCLGGIEAFHQKRIPSLSTKLTIDLALKKGYSPPKTIIESGEPFKIGNLRLVSSFFGPAHTLDNIVTYIPEEAVLFGGCMVKAIKAGKGNLQDADPGAWSGTIGKIKMRYPDLKIVIPGHGDPGGMELLDYTIGLFEP